MSGVSLDPAEVLGVLRIARHDRGQPVTVDRPDKRELLAVTVGRPIAGADVLWLDEVGKVYRIGEPFELAARRPEVFRRNLLPLTRADLDPLPGEGARRDTDAIASQNDLAVELSSLAEGQIDGLGGEDGGRQDRDRMRAILDLLDRLP